MAATNLRTGGDEFDACVREAEQQFRQQPGLGKYIWAADLAPCTLAFSEKVAGIAFPATVAAMVQRIHDDIAANPQDVQTVGVDARAVLTMLDGMSTTPTP